MKKDEKGSSYKNLSVDAETYLKIGELSKKDKLTKLRCIYYMTRYFIENDLSVMPGNQVTKEGATAQIKQDLLQNTDRVIRLLKAFEKEYFRPVATKTATTDMQLSDIVSFLHDKQIMEHEAQKDTCEQNKTLTESLPSVAQSVTASFPFLTQESEALKARNRELEIEAQRKGLLLATAVELLEKVISPSFCALTERGEFAARSRKFRSQDIEEIVKFIGQCT